MSRARGRWLVPSMLSVAAVLCAGRASAESADVHLKSGLKLRGEVRLTESEVIVRNELGELRYPRELVERIVPVTDAASKPVEAPAEAEEVGVGPPPRELPPTPLLSALDIQRLKLHELRVDGPPEELRVRFARAKDEQELPREVLEALSQRADFDRNWERILQRGALAEKVQLIARETGARYADRLVIVDDPEVFATFRRHVLPLVVKGCARSGCHSGPEAQVYRFPDGSQRSAEYAYTTFALLDRMVSRHGPLINRDDPEGSVLLAYMLPSQDNPQVHPDVPGKRKVTPVLHNRRSPAYRRVVEWINALRTPHPEYGLDYEFPPLPATQPAADEPDEPAQLSPAP